MRLLYKGTGTIKLSCQYKIEGKESRKILPEDKIILDWVTGTKLLTQNPNKWELLDIKVNIEPETKKMTDDLHILKQEKRGRKKTKYAN